MNFSKLLILILSAFAMASCHKVTVVVEGIPENTPPNAEIFVGGNFNYWDPGDRSFKLRRLDSTRYAVDLPIGWGTIAYKMTRGDWSTVEMDPCGHQISNRQINYFGTDTVYQRIESWQDLGPTHCPKVVIRLKRLPKETPAKDPIYLAGNFNNWSDRDPNFKMQPDKKGNLTCTLGEASSQLEFKFTRGSWEKEEADAAGNVIINRQFQPGSRDTLDVQIDGWKDIDPSEIARRVTFRVLVPPTTPRYDSVYLVGTFNSWNPGDRRYAMRRIGPNEFVYTLNKEQGKLEYKITRGSWKTEEVDSYGGIPGNHILRTLNDTVTLSVARWLDDPFDVTIPPVPGAPGRHPDAPPAPTSSDLKTQAQGDAALRNVFKDEKRAAEFNKLNQAMQQQGANLQKAVLELKQANLSKDKARIAKAEANLNQAQKQFAARAQQAVEQDKAHAADIYNRKAQTIGPIGRGRRWLTITVRNTSVFPSKIWVRAQIPFDSTNGNFGFSGTYMPGHFEQFSVPEGTVIFKTDGQYWDGARPKEKRIRRLQMSDDGIVFDAKDLEY